MLLPELGVGIVYAPGLEPLLEPRLSLVDVIEVEPQTLWHYHAGQPTVYRMPDSSLAHLAGFSQPKIVHSVGHAVGGMRHADPDFLAALNATIDDLEAPWASEHLSFTSIVTDTGGFHTGFMLPPLQTAEGVAVAADNIRAFSSSISVPFLLEVGVNYLQPREGEFKDGEFVAAVVNEADCGIILDLHNLWTNERNGRQKVSEFLEQIPLDRVFEIHLAGGDEYQGYWLDAHSGAIPAPIIALAEDLVPRLENLKSLIFEIFPTFVPIVGTECVMRQLEIMRGIWDRRCRSSESHTMIGVRKPELERVVRSDCSVQPSVKIWERALGELVTRGETSLSLGKTLGKDKGVSIMRDLIGKFRSGALVNILSMTIRLILLQRGKEFLDHILNAYFTGYSPQPYASEEAKCFSDYLKAHNFSIPYLQDVIDFELAVMESQFTHETQVVHLRHDPYTLMHAINNESIPSDLKDGDYEVLIPPL